MKQIVQGIDLLSLFCSSSPQNCISAIWKSSLKNATRIDETATLSSIIHTAIESDKPIIVTTDGKDVGIITRADVLRTVIDGTEVS